jgi:hypothetical protein
MWEFFSGISLACFFAVYWLKRSARPKPRQHEVVYAPKDEILQYKTRKKEAEYVDVTPFSPEAPKQQTRSTYSAYKAPAPPEYRRPEKDEFVEYAASVVTDESASAQPNNADTSPAPQKEVPLAAENEDDEEKKQKFSTLRFFNS